MVNSAAQLQSQNAAAWTGAGWVDGVVCKPSQITDQPLPVMADDG